MFKKSSVIPLSSSDCKSASHKSHFFKSAAALFAILCIIFYFWFGLLLFFIGCRRTAAEEEALANSRASGLQEAVADEVLRLHIIADSNSDADQQIKLIVKDTVLTYLKPHLADITTKEQAIQTISAMLDELSDIAAKVLAENGFCYSATASLSRSYFPIKTYGDLTLPAGEYDALKICLGSAGGKNWWCLVFPQLCFVDVTYGVLPEESHEELKTLLTEEEYSLLFPGNTDLAALSREAADQAYFSIIQKKDDEKPNVRFWIVEQIKKLFQ